MKKLVLVAVWASIITTFLALNYLLWEREKSADPNNPDNIEKSTIKELQTAINRLEDENGKLKEEIDSLTVYNSYYQEEIRKKNVLIYELKKIADLGFLEDIITEWVESVDKKDYRSAFRLFSNEMIYQKEIQLKMREYFNPYERLIKSFKLHSVELDLEHTEKGKNGELIFRVVIDVKHNDPRQRDEYLEGLNTRYFFMVYDEITEGWYIGGIANEI